MVSISIAERPISCLKGALVVDGVEQIPECVQLPAFEVFVLLQRRLVPLQTRLHRFQFGVNVTVLRSRFYLSFPKPRRCLRYGTKA